MIGTSAGQPLRADGPAPRYAPRVVAAEDGTTAVEYALVGAVVVIAFLGAATLLGLEVGQLYALLMDSVADVVG